MSVRIVYKGFSQDVAASEAVDILTRLFKGDRRKAEEAYVARHCVLQTVDSEAEASLILPRLQRLGMLCEVDAEDAEDFGDSMDDFKDVVVLVTCPFCQFRQVPADSCMRCGRSFVLKRQATKSTAAAAAYQDDEEEEETESRWRVIFGWLPSFGMPSTSTLIAIITVAGILGGGAMFVLGGKESNPIAMLINGMMSMDNNKTAETMTYDPESGENPYAKRLESMNVDQEKFSKAAGVASGQISTDEVNTEIGDNAAVKHAVDNAISRSGSSTGDTETDEAIRKATGEE